MKSTIALLTIPLLLISNALSAQNNTTPAPDQTDQANQPLIIASTESHQETTNRCRYYVEESIRQHQTNLKNSCGYNGLRWNNNKAGQLAWCMQTPKRITAAESTARSEKLTACFSKKTDPANPKNQPTIPQACNDPKKQHRAVKTIYHSYRYERSLKQPVDNGLIRYDYNRDGKPDYLFLEAKGEMGRITACLSQGQSYQRQISDISFYLPGGSGAEEYRLSQHNDLLNVEINYFGHNEGSSWRKVAYRYQPEKRGFVIMRNEAEVYPVIENGQPYPMGTPQTPVMISGQ